MVPGTECYCAREFYQNVYPNLTIVNIEKPACYLRKFSPDGKNLIAFSSDQLSLEIYEYKGSAAAGELLQHCNEEIIPNIPKSYPYEIRSKIFDTLFKLKFVVNMENSEKQLNRECSLFTSDGKYVIIGSAIYLNDEMRPHFYELYTNNEAITPTASCPLEDYTLYIIDFQNGKVTDSVDFKVDKIILSHNQGLYLYNDTLAVLSIQHQTIHIYQILDGTFLHVRSIGRFCCEEEQYLFNARTVPMGTYRPFRETNINSLKHRILVYLFREAKEKAEAGDKVALRKFYQNFDTYKALRMWKIQLLDDDHLLIKYAHEDVVTLKVNEPNTHASYFVIFNIWEKKILAVYHNTSTQLLYLFENFCDSFRNARLNAETQFTSSPSNNIYSNVQHQRFKQTIQGAKGGGMIEAVKRLLAQLPISAQSFSSSPYLDMSLFSYDDKFISVMERPKAFAEYPIRFFARDSGLLRFRIHAGVGIGKQAPSASRRLVAFIFHPTEAFVISVQRINTEYIANFHIRRN